MGELARRSGTACVGRPEGGTGHTRPEEFAHGGAAQRSLRRGPIHQASIQRTRKETSQERPRRRGIPVKRRREDRPHRRQHLPRPAGAVRRPRRAGNLRGGHHPRHRGGGGAANRAAPPGDHAARSSGGSSSPGRSTGGRTVRSPTPSIRHCRTRRASPTPSRTGRTRRTSPSSPAPSQADYVTFRPWTGCSSHVGKRGRAAVHQPGGRVHEGEYDPRDRPRRRLLARAEPRGSRRLRHDQLGEDPARLRAQLQPAHHRWRRHRRVRLRVDHALPARPRSRSTAARRSRPLSPQR